MTHEGVNPGSASAPNIQAQWDRLRAELEAAANYMLWSDAPLGGPGRNAVIDNLLPGLLLVRAAATLDNALEELVDRRNLKHPTTRRRNMKLAHRIDCAEAAGAVGSAAVLRRIKDDRNSLAHEPVASCT